jgi:hypothetical protein
VLAVDVNALALIDALQVLDEVVVDRVCAGEFENYLKMNCF